ncbi:MAG: 4Fe-4S dicluster domain-containing protein [Bacteroidales bacterium]|nr:4Fe-4S dicluster domain-containing protein [Bacteroidales bacterium]
MKPLVEILPDKCTNCFTCVRICPVKAIRAVPNGLSPEININRCIGCGACVDSCAPNAIEYRSSIEEAKNILKLNKEVAAIVSTGIAAEFDDITDYRKFVQMIKSLGIAHVYELSFGADLIAMKYLNLFSDFKGRYYITSFDPVVVNYIEKYHPNLINNLTPFISPKIAMAKVIHKKHGDKAKIIYIGSNIADKDEILLYNDDGKIDCMIIFPELRKLFKEFNIDENIVDYSDFDAPLGFKGSLYPLRNGLIQAADIDENLLTTHVISVEGKTAMLESIREFENNVKVIHRHLHVTYGNALSGPGITSRGNKLLKEHLIIKYANKRIKNFFRAEWYNDLDEYGSLDFKRSYKANDQRLPPPPKEKIEEALQILGKKDDDYSNCQQCGYSTCEEFAVDMAKGIVVPEMCHAYAVRNTKNYDESLKELNEKITKTRKALQESEEKVRSEHDSAHQAQELTNAILDNLRAGIVVVDYQLKIVKANNTFSRILGEEAREINEVIPGLVGADLKKLFSPEIYNLFSFVITNSEPIDTRDVIHNDSLLNLSIFPIVENQLAGGIVRDMKAPEVQRAEVIKRVSEVIDKNLEMVQQIGFLMGEGASDIEKMLNSVIKFYEQDKPK